EFSRQRDRQFNLEHCQFRLNQPPVPRESGALFSVRPRESGDPGRSSSTGSNFVFLDSRLRGNERCVGERVEIYSARPPAKAVLFSPFVPRKRYSFSPFVPAKAGIQGVLHQWARICIPGFPLGRSLPSFRGASASERTRNPD